MAAMDEARLSGDAVALAALEASVPGLAARFAARAGEHDRAASFPAENFRDLVAAGWARLTVPVAQGGIGAGLLDTVRLLEALAQGDGSTALAMAMHLQTLGAAAESGSWPRAALERLARDVVERGALVNSCSSEPELGSPSRGGLPRTRAERRGDGWVISGRKNFASLSPILAWFVIPAALVDEPGTIGRFLVPAGEGLRVEPNWDPLGMRATGSHDLLLEAVRVPADALLYRQSGAPSEAELRTANAWFTLSVTAVYLGVGQAAVLAAADYALHRVPTALGRPIATLEPVQRQLGQAELALRAARAWLQDVARRWDEAPAERPATSPDVAGAKVAVTNAAIQATDLAMRVAGGAAMRRDLPLERHYRDVRAGLYHTPADEQAYVMLGSLVLERLQDRSAP
jgi:alkylation response protein AidB-like acyl-CoA dehydrogenase